MRATGAQHRVAPNTKIAVKSISQFKPVQPHYYPSSKGQKSIKEFQALQNFLISLFTHLCECITKLPECIGNASNNVGWRDSLCAPLEF